MIQRLSKKTILLFCVVTLSVTSFLFVSCQKEISGEGVDLGGSTPPDLTTKIQSSVSGFVTDENNAVVKDATVKIGSRTTTTDKFGYFELKNVQVVKEAAVVTITKPGYFNGIKTYMATAGKSAFFRIKLLPKTSAGSIDAATGGSVTLTNGMKVALPASAVVNAATNAAYTGQVNVAVQWLNPVADDLNRTMPGDLRGIDTDNDLKLLATYGMAAVELSGSGGELLQVAAGKKATLTFPVPSAIAGSAPASIPLWYFDENIGLWKEEGSAVKEGNNYKGEVAHFTYWNCDIPLNTAVNFSATIVDATENPIPSVHVSVKYANGNYTGAHGYTDTSGFVNGRVPGNSQLILEIYTDYACNGPAYTQNITTTNATLDLGTITISSNNTAIISGTITDCNNAAVTDGYAIIQNGYYNYKAEVKADGTFSTNILICGGTSASVNIIAVDRASQEQSNTLTQTIAGGNNAVGNLQACGITVEQFINYSVDGTSYSLSAPADSFTQRISSQPLPSSVILMGSSKTNTPVYSYASIGFTSTGIAVGSSQSLTQFFISQLSDTTQLPVTPITVNITEYGSVGQFIAGNFSGTLTGPPPANTPHPVTCTFRVRRSF